MVSQVDVDFDADEFFALSTRVGTRNRRGLREFNPGVIDQIMLLIPVMRSTKNPSR